MKYAKFSMTFFAGSWFLISPRALFCPVGEAKDTLTVSSEVE